MNPNRNLGLDYLRALAITVVLCNHALFGFYIDAGKVSFQGLTASISAATVLSIEWLFVLSGYLVGTMMIRSFEKNDGWFKSSRDFWLRRWFRTFPNYFLFLGVNLVLIWQGLAPGEFEFEYLIFSQNLAWVERVPHFFGESWSLALDEWFYFILPLMIGFMGFQLKNNRDKFLLASLLLIVLPVVARAIQPVTTEFFAWDAAIRRITIFHMDATGWGVLAACVNKWFPKWWHRHHPIVTLVGLLSMLSGVLLVIGLVHPHQLGTATYFLSHTFSITLMSAGTFLMLPWLTRLSIFNTRTTWVVEKMSLYSYSIYLVHFPLIFIFKWMFAPDVQTSEMKLAGITGAWFLMTLSMSALIFYFFEKPMSDLRERFTQRVDASPFK